MNTVSSCTQLPLTNRIRNIAEDYGIKACSKPVVKNHAFDIEETERTISKSEGMLVTIPLSLHHTVQ